MFENVFNTTTVDQVIAESNERKKQINLPKIPFLKIDDGQTVILRFIDSTPLMFHQHSVRDPQYDNFRSITCPRTGCPLCAKGDRATVAGAYRVIHLDNIEKDEQTGQEEVVPKVKIFVRGITVLEVLEWKNKKKNITSENIEVERKGAGFDSKYFFEFNGDTTLPSYDPVGEDEIKEVLSPRMDVLNRLALSYIPKAKSKGTGTKKADVGF